MSGKSPGDDQDERDSTPPESDKGSERDSTPPENDSTADDDAPSSSDDDRARTLKSAGPAKLGKKARREQEARLAKKKAMTIAIAVGVVALGAGAAAGWFGHIEQGKRKIRAETTAAGASSASGTCGAWETKICSTSGAQSLACQQAKGASALLTPTACDAALETVPATLAKVKSQRLPCDNLVQKLCKDLPPGSQTCDMIKERTPLFPPDKCKEMLGSYDKVLAEVRQIDQNPQPPMGMSPHGADDGHGH